MHDGPNLGKQEATASPKAGQNLRVEPMNPVEAPKQVLRRRANAQTLRGARCNLFTGSARRIS